MTYNLYLGADLAPMLGAETAEAFDVALSGVLQHLSATDFRTRAPLIADVIGDVRPDLLALQEAVVWRTGTPVGDLDSLQLLLAALRAKGHEYWPVAIGRGPDVQGPRTAHGALRFTNCNVILARSRFCDDIGDINPGRSAPFSTNVVVPHPALGTFAITRGWTSVDVQVRGTRLRFASTHLEDSHPDVRRAQAAELVRVFNAAPMPVVLVGDFNADAAHSPTYRTLIEAGWVDAWGGAPGGYTCCQAADLRNDRSLLDTRIDYILSRGPVEIRNPRIVGDHEGRRHAAGLWPSDHAAVVATVSLR
jgi:endonuclease/exonuclease/phosphatase family metal-dependent hydrolase